MSSIKYTLVVKDQNYYSDILSVLQDTDEDFVPSLSSKFSLEQVVDKYVLSAHAFIAYIDEKPAGVVTFYVNKDADSYLSLIAVKKEYRGLQIGKNLEIKCIDYCKSERSNGISVNMRKSNARLFDSRLALGYIIKKEYQLEYSDEGIVDLYFKF